MPGVGLVICEIYFEFWQKKKPILHGKSMAASWDHKCLPLGIMVSGCKLMLMYITDT